MSRENTLLGSQALAPHERLDGKKILVWLLAAAVPWVVIIGTAKMLMTVVG